MRFLFINVYIQFGDYPVCVARNLSTSESQGGTSWEILGENEILGADCEILGEMLRDSRGKNGLCR